MVSISLATSAKFIFDSDWARPGLCGLDNRGLRLRVCLLTTHCSLGALGHRESGLNHHNENRDDDNAMIAFQFSNLLAAFRLFRFPGTGKQVAVGKLSAPLK